MSKTGDKIIIGVDTYIAHQCTWDGCSGCIADGDLSLCTKIAEHVNCYDCIWIKQQPVETQATTCNQTKGEPEINTTETTEEPKYTLAEFLKACDDWYGSDECDIHGLGRNNHFKQFLERKNNPEYQEYLRLKAIFG